MFAPLARRGMSHPQRLRGARPAMRDCIVFLSALSLGSTVASAQIRLQDDAAPLGVEFVWNDTWGSGDFGSGVALEDFDGDGDLDLFLGTKLHEPLRVYRNDGERFTDISEALGIRPGYDIKQVLFADLDDDGHRDLILGLWETVGPAVLSGRLMILRNEAGQGFTDLSSAPVDSTMEWLPTGIAAGDIDRDGDLDLYVSVWKFGPPEASSANRLLRNEGGFRFDDVASQLGVADIKKSYQPVLADLDGDGWLDIVVAEDKFGGITYYQSDGVGGFVDRTRESGLDGYFGPPGTDDADKYVDGMGIAVGDHDQDGDLDLYVTNVFTGNVFYENLGDGTFEQIAAATGTSSERNGWGCGFLDLDHDGWLDLYVVNFGSSGSASASPADRVYRNNGASGLPVTYTDVGPTTGVMPLDEGFGMAAGDLDRDGRLDVVVSNAIAPARIYRNRTPQVGHWLTLTLQGIESNRDGIGAWVEVSAGGRSWVAEQRAGTSYLSFDSHELEFGLGAATAVEEIRIRWPSGRVDVWNDQPVNSRLRLTEGGELKVSTAPVPLLGGEPSAHGFALHWRVVEPHAFERFEVERARGALAMPVATIASQPDRTDYHWVDVQARAGDVYTLFALGAGLRLASASVRVTAPAASRLEVGPAVPNPFNPHTTLRFRVAEDTPVQLRVVDAQGRTLRRFAPPAGSGWRTLSWDGNDDRGRPMASGTYHFVAETAVQRQSTPLTLIR